MSDREYEKWVVVFRSGTDYEADIVRDRLDDSGVDAVVLTQRDHAFNLNVGELAPVHVLVPPDQVQRAEAILESPPLSDVELNEAALNADPSAPSARTESEEAMLDTGIEEINFAPPEEDEDRR